MIYVRCPLSSSFRSPEMTALEIEKMVYVHNKKETVITRSQHGFTKKRVSLRVHSSPLTGKSDW